MDLVKNDEYLMPGVEVIRNYIKVLPSNPGVYRMVNEKEEVLYIGKAKNLKKRVANYTNLNRQSTRIKRMVSMTRSMEFITTHTEAEALLLEANLIKKLLPRYNILLRDDKSFPSILITQGHDFPQVLKHRGARKQKGEYFGPFASVASVNQSLAMLQRAFLLRTCTDSVFAARTRPCLLFQIKRCAGPCVDTTKQQDYSVLVEQARDFLTGKSQKIQKELADNMQKASDALEFEKAAELRDRIHAISSIQTHQHINAAKIIDADILGLYSTGGRTCVQVFFLRGGCNNGNCAYYPSHPSDANQGKILEAFIGQFYANKMPPKLILLSQEVPQKEILIQALSNKSERKIQVEVPSRGEKKAIVSLVVENARKALGRKMAENTSQNKLLDGLSKILKLGSLPKRIEIYDNSHISGTNSVGGMVVVGPEGFIKNAYRKFNIRTVSRNPLQGGPKAGDDYAMMREVLTRRFSRAINEDPDRSSSKWPDLILIDGGAGHLSTALEVFEDLGINDVSIMAIAKGPNRNAGEERFFVPNRSPFSLDSRDPVLYFLQRLRDEAHRFAIGAHRTRRGKSIEYSTLDAIQGIGGMRKKSLLYHFGSARGVSEAGVEDLETVDGISRAMAEKIYDWFHPED